MNRQGHEPPDPFHLDPLIWWVLMIAAAAMIVTGAIR